MRLRHLWLDDFRCYERLDVTLAPGLTVVVGANGQGKTSLLEAVAWVATARSLRGVPDTALVRAGAAQAIVRAEIERSDRELLVEAEIRATGRNRIQVNRHPLARSRDLLGALRVTVFAPDDLQLVKGGPAERRTYLDDLLVAMAPRYDAVCGDYDRVLRHRNALLRGGMRDTAAHDTLAVFDEQLVRAGAELVRGRVRLVERLVGPVRDAYAALAGTDPGVDAVYEAEWAEGPVTVVATDAIDVHLRAALQSRRRQEVERGLTLVGPHRDEWRLRIDGLDARNYASQGEQRTLAFALRLAGHRVCTELLGEEPILLLDDVFSELDPHRASALVAYLPHGQTLLTTAGVVPEEVHPERRMRVVGGRVVEDDA